MTQQTHVPKFGNWDKDNVPYTAYFDNARKGKGSKMMNPNDPEENPEAFMHGGEGLQRVIAVNEPHPHKPFEVAKHDVDTQATADPRWKNNFYLKGLTSESASDKSGSDHSLMHSGHPHGKSRKKSSSSFSSLVSGHSRQTSESYPSTNTHRKIASVPKFGAWDEADPSSGDGFTVIFNRVKEEKHNASSQFPTVAHQPSHYSDNKKRHEKCSSLSKFCCCFFCLK